MLCEIEKGPGFFFLVAATGLSLSVRLKLAHPFTSMFQPNGGRKGGVRAPSFLLRAGPLSCAHRSVYISCTGRVELAILDAREAGGQACAGPNSGAYATERKKGRLYTEEKLVSALVVHRGKQKIPNLQARVGNAEFEG